MNSVVYRSIKSAVHIPPAECASSAIDFAGDLRIKFSQTKRQCVVMVAEHLILLTSVATYFMGTLVRGSWLILGLSTMTEKPLSCAYLSIGKTLPSSRPLFMHTDRAHMLLIRSVNHLPCSYRACSLDQHQYSLLIREEVIRNKHVALWFGWQRSFW
jgi:hypothetical protein